MNISNTLEINIKDKIINELNQALYLSLNISLYEANHYFGYYNGYIYKLTDRVYKKHGPSGLRKEVKYIVQFLHYLFYKLENNYFFKDYILVTFYFRTNYKHFSQRKDTPSNQLDFSFIN